MKTSSRVKSFLSPLTTSLAVALFVLSMGAGSCRNGGTTALVATVRSIDEGIRAFTDWAVVEEKKIAEDAVGKCKKQPTKLAYQVCVADVIQDRRSKIDHVKLVIKIYGDTLVVAHGAQTQDVAEAAAGVTNALASVGIYFGAGK